VEQRERLKRRYDECQRAKKLLAENCAPRKLY
jgi:hypothetical protein